MTAPRLYSCYFTVPSGKAWPPEWYERLARVLRHSAKKHSPGWTVDVRQIEPSTPRTVALGGSSQSSFAYNTHKLIDWNGVVQRAAEGSRLLITDADMMVLRPLDPVWDHEFDIALTEKRAVTRLPLNGGVVFLRVNARSRRWFKAWLDWNMRLIGDGALHRGYRARYCGMNQAALGALLENGGRDLAHVIELPCAEWNCESATWRFFDRAHPPRMVHLKSGLRRGLMDPVKYPITDTHQREIAFVWEGLEIEALCAAGIVVPPRA